MDNRLDAAADPQNDALDEVTESQSLDPQLSAPQIIDQQLIDPKSTELSTEFVGRWSQLISTTNWEKGKIILQWRETLIGSEAAAATYSDEAWSRRVGGVTPQHVGRLRRVFERFGANYTSYAELYWSHFLAATDWDDAELWLEGASQSGWSVSQMRKTRWEANGSDPSQKPEAAEELVSLSDDEDYSPLAEVGDETTGKADGPRNVSEGPRYDEPDFGDERDTSNAATAASEDDDLAWDDPAAAANLESPFAKLPSLPVDLAEALEQFKLGIIRHRSNSWAEVGRGDVVLALDALKAFANQ